MAIITQEAGLASSINQINALCDQSSAIFERIGTFYNEYPPGIEQGRAAASQLIERVFRGELDQISGTLPKLEEFKQKLIHALPYSDRFMKKKGLSVIELIGSQYINACQCCKNMSLGRRIDFNYSLIDMVNQLFQDKRPLVICSVGSGNCYHELMIHAAFVGQGHKVSWILIEPYVDKESSTTHKATVEFKKMVKFLSGETSVELKAMTSGQYATAIRSKAENQLPNLLLAIDIDDLANPVIAALKSVADPAQPCILMGLGKEKKEDGVTFDMWPD